MIERMDAGIGRVLETLSGLGLRDNTIVLFTSDNGPWLGRADGLDCRRFNGPYRGMKQDVLEGGVRVPAILRWPDGLPTQAQCQGMIHFCDWLPTFLSACGVRSDFSLPLDGVDVLPGLRGEPQRLPQTRFWQFNRYEPVPHCNAAMRDGDWKLFWPFIPETRRKLSSDNDSYREQFRRPHYETSLDRSPVPRTLSPPREPELYNIAEDPAESCNLAADHPDRVRRMVGAWDRWFEGVERERRGLPEYRGRTLSVPG
jgi:arylsulfatase A-like enzyme